LRYAVNNNSYLLPYLAWYACSGQQKLQTFDKLAFYNVMATGSLEDINGELTIVKEASIPKNKLMKGHC